MTPDELISELQRAPSNGEVAVLRFHKEWTAGHLHAIPVKKQIVKVDTIPDIIIEIEPDVE